MASLNHAKITNALDAIVTKCDKSSFFFNFLLAYGTPKTTISRIQAGDAQRNLATIKGDIAVPQKVYFRAVQPGSSVVDALAEIRSLPVLERGKIRFVLATDFVTVATYDKKVDDTALFDFAELPLNYDFFLPLTGKFEKPIEHAEHPADIKACEKMGKLYDSICTANKYSKDNLHTLNVFLTRLLFCFFAEDTGIFAQANQMTSALKATTQEDGSDVASFFEQLFLALSFSANAPERTGLPHTFQKFPYVNGGLFLERIEVPQFNARARRLLLECGSIEWREISPVIFGSMFQAVMDPAQRRSMGAHYTSEKNIFKVLRPLFLDDLHEEFEQIQQKKQGKKVALQAFHDKISSLGFLDPACGCGNFLVVAFRELKELELQVLQALRADDPKFLMLNVTLITKVSIDQFSGIEIEEFPAEVARVSMWLMEHVMNVKFGKSLGGVFPSIPLQHSATIVCANALTTPWESVVAPEKLHYIMGNPPFAGSRMMSIDQKQDLLINAANVKNAKLLDYVAAWFIKAANFISKTQIQTGFVSTNSICQGEQVHALWSYILDKGLAINFAYQTFKWKNEAKSNAAVYCIIVGFGQPTDKRFLFKTPTITSEHAKISVKEINPYLYDADSVIIFPSSKKLFATNDIYFGNMPRDGGNLIIEPEDLCAFLEKEPLAKQYIRKLVGSVEFLHGLDRYCLWLTKASERALCLPEIQRRLEKVKAMRLASKAGSTIKFAQTPHLFCQITQHEDATFLLIPIVSSERRQYIPIGFMAKDTIVTNLVYIIPHASLYHFGILTSAMHMGWMRTVCGRLKSDYRYSRDLCYNTFPWPSATEKQQQHIESLAQTVLDVRETYPELTLAQMYSPETMPQPLQDAHTALDIAVDRLYQNKPFADDEQRLQLLFTLYAKLVKQNPGAQADYTDEEESEDD